MIGGEPQFDPKPKGEGTDTEREVPDPTEAEGPITWSFLQDLVEAAKTYDDVEMVKKNPELVIKKLTALKEQIGSSRDFDKKQAVEFNAKLENVIEAVQRYAETESKDKQRFLLPQIRDKILELRKSTPRQPGEELSEKEQNELRQALATVRESKTK